MGRITKDRAANRVRSSGRQNTQREKNRRWDPENPDEDPCRDLRDIYEDEEGVPDSGDYIWPENEEPEDD